MTCYVNGEKWVARGNFLKDLVSTYSGTGVGARISSDGLLVNGSTKKNEAILIRIADYKGIGEYYLNGIVNNSGFRTNSYGYFKNESGSEYYDSSATGKIIIKYDESNSDNVKIIAGTFSFEARNKSGEVVSITEGHFDSNY